MVIDKETVKKRFGKSMITYKQHAIVQKRICEKLIGCLQKNKETSFVNLLEVGCGPGLLTEEILRTMPPRHYFVNDIVPVRQTKIMQVFEQNKYSSWHFLEGDAEKIEFPGKLDGIISTSTIQWFNNLPHFFPKVNDALNTGGVLAFSTFGPDNFKEIKNTLNKGLTYASLNDLLAMLPLNFNVLCAYEYLETLYFQHPSEVLRHIKLTGVNGTGSPDRNLAGLRNFEKQYYLKNKINEKGEVVLTYHPIIIVAKKRE